MDVIGVMACPITYQPLRDSEFVFISLFVSYLCILSSHRSDIHPWLFIDSTAFSLIIIASPMAKSGLPLWLPLWLPLLLLLFFQPWFLPWAFVLSAVSLVGISIAHVSYEAFLVTATFTGAITVAIDFSIMEIVVAFFPNFARIAT